MYFRVRLGEEAIITEGRDSASIGQETGCCCAYHLADRFWMPPYLFTRRRLYASRSSPLSFPACEFRIRLRGFHPPTAPKRKAPPAANEVGARHTRGPQSLSQSLSNSHQTLEGASTRRRPIDSPHSPHSPHPASLQIPTTRRRTLALWMFRNPSASSHHPGEKRAWPGPRHPHAPPETRRTMASPLEGDAISLGDAKS